ncbi:MAG: 4Fe-4S binding protein, partial [Deltaproteobacteria bacterium]
MAKNTKKGKIIIDRERCKGCHLCIEVCPNGVIEVDESLNAKGYAPAL